MPNYTVSRTRRNQDTVRRTFQQQQNRWNNNRRR